MNHDDNLFDTDTPAARGPTATADTQPLTLDPPDWDAIRQLGHQMLDDMFDHLVTVRERPVWQAMPAATVEALREPVPLEGQPLHQVYEQFKTHVLPYSTGNLHPRFFGWVMGNGTVTGMLGDMLAAAMNPHMAGYNQSPAQIEKQVVRWLAEIMGFPTDAGGLLVSGGTMANLNALAVARHVKAGFDLRRDGLQQRGLPPLTVYGSSETHGWINKACELMGLGRNAFRAIPVDADYRIDVAQCRQAIQRDLAAGARPFCLIATVGTVNTGAMDDVTALRQLADEFGLWLHIDGAFGALLAFAPTARQQVQAQATADSIAFDLHKWGYLPFEAACVLVRHGDDQRNTFTHNAAYLAPFKRALAKDMTYFADRGLQLSRGFKALKIWLAMKEHGVHHIGRVIEQNLHQAQYLKQLVDQHPELERLAPVGLNIVCFRYRPPARTSTDADLNALNQELLLRLQESGLAVPSQTVLNNQFAIRVCITNHRTRFDDLDLLVEKVVEIGRGIFHHE